MTPPSETNGVSLDGISKRFGSGNVLSDVSLNIREGEFLTLVGPSGCGKSTLLRIIAGLERATKGSVKIGGRRVDDLPPKERDVAMVFQSYALYPHMTVSENLAVPLRMRRLSQLQRLPLLGRISDRTRTINAEIDAEVQSAASLLGIKHLMERKPSQLSGGQRQRVALGRAIVRRPKVFLMDEPLSNLDAQLRVHMRFELAQLHRRLGVTFIYVTHDQAEAMTMSDRVAVMMDGELLQVDTPAAIYDDPAHLRVASFISNPAINVAPGSVRSDRTVEMLDVALPTLNSPDLSPGTAVKVVWRPEAADLCAPGSGVLAGQVARYERLGAEVFVHVQHSALDEPLIVRLEAGDERSKGMAAPGQQVGIKVKTERILLFRQDGSRIWTDVGRAAA